MNQPARILVADQDVLLADALISCLGQRPSFIPVARAAQTSDLLDIALRAEVHLVVLSASLPPLGGLSARSRLAVTRPAIRFVHLSLHPIDTYLEEILKDEHSGYAVRADGLEALMAVVSEAAQGRTAFSPSVRERLAAGTVKVAQPQKNSRLSQLTQRQVEAVRLVGSGLSYKEIARAMGIERKTVDNHITSAMQKLDIHNRGQLMIYAFREGLVEPGMLDWVEGRPPAPQGQVQLRA
ncbi:MAG: response regulator transcription factor [Phycisphaerales bacterium]|nr:response regulator transcription factor [Phycisphaerales bacterium]